MSARVTSVADLLARAALRAGEATLPDGSTVAVREMTIDERGAFAGISKDLGRVGAWVAATCCTEPKLTEEEARAMSPAYLEAIISKVYQLSGLVKEPNAGNA